MSFLILCFITSIASVVIVTDTGGKYGSEIFDGIEMEDSEPDRYIVAKLKEINKRRKDKDKARKRQEIATFVEKHKKKIEDENPQRSRVEVIDEVYESSTREAVTDVGDPCKATNVCHSQAVCISIGKAYSLSQNKTDSMKIFRSIIVIFSLGKCWG